MGFFRMKSSNRPSKGQKKTKESQAIPGEPSSETSPSRWKRRRRSPSPKKIITEDDMTMPTDLTLQADKGVKKKKSVSPKTSKYKLKNEPRQKKGEKPIPRSSREKRDKSPKEKIKKENVRKLKKFKIRWRSRSPKTKKEKPPKVQETKYKPDAESLSIVRAAPDTDAKYPGVYFRDGVHKVDFILVTTKQIIQNPESIKLINNYVENLKSRKLLYEFEHGRIISIICYIQSFLADGRKNIIELQNYNNSKKCLHFISPNKNSQLSNLT